MFTQGIDMMPLDIRCNQTTFYAFDIYVDSYFAFNYTIFQATIHIYQYAFVYL